MKKTRVQCWKTVVQCADGTQQTLVFTVPDFGDAHQLFTCPKCGALFAVDPDEEFYTKRSFLRERQKLQCPQCGTSLADALAYPANFRCESTGQLDHHEQDRRTIPPQKDSIVMEVWNPLT